MVAISKNIRGQESILPGEPYYTVYKLTRLNVARRNTLIIFW